MLTNRPHATVYHDEGSVKAIDDKPFYILGSTAQAFDKGVSIELSPWPREQIIVEPEASIVYTRGWSSDDRGRSRLGTATGAVGRDRDLEPFLRQNGSSVCQLRPP